ncbi:MAG: hypothetical protein H9893_04585, partial [Candidatus Niameybacter stercoravium]|nr:hypothetical protein [Candidatus Niameybacter stercoravium]
NIHNVVIWLDYKTIQNKYIQRLRGLGMNMVFFDIIQDTPYADCVCLDNEHAISTIYQYVRDKGHQNVVYVSRENISPSSYLERDIAFSKLNPLGMVWTFPWDFKNYLANRPDDFVFDYFMPYYKPSSIICSDGELGIMLKKSFQKHGIRDVFLVSLDDFDECEELGITVYKQDYNLFAEKIFSCLMEQNSNCITWKADTYRIKGELIIRE